ncbi:hypothetical protein AB0323_00235 [Arthrobacter sp. NPDC080031]|uniref:hypothetical protein n=1 Tax=Arthrobacter sp. NPDC080031 TaxID=3155918 RepID=UPI00344F2282
MSNYEPDDQQIHAAVEVIFADPTARRRYAAAEISAKVGNILERSSRDLYSTRVIRTHTVYNHGRITVSGLRTPLMAAQIAALGATNQTSDAVERLLVGAHPTDHGAALVTRS